MALTLSNLHKIKSSLTELLKAIDDTIKVKERLSPFKTFEDVQNAEILQRNLPEQFYYFRYFKYSIELNRDKKGYYFYIEHFAPNNYKLIHSRMTNQYRLIEDNFDNAVALFGELVIECLHLVSKKDTELFYIY